MIPASGTEVFTCSIILSIILVLYLNEIFTCFLLWFFVVIYKQFYSYHSGFTKTGVIIRLLPLRWRHNDHAGVSNHQPHGCLLNRLFRRKSKKTSKLASLAFVREIHRGPVNFPHKWPVTRKMFPFDDVIMRISEAIMENKRSRIVVYKTSGESIMICILLSVNIFSCQLSYDMNPQLEYY